MTLSDAPARPSGSTPAPRPAQAAAARAAMVLAAGLGTRMRPLTLTTPKPLVRVAGRSLLDHALDAVDRAGLGLAVVNVHHLAGQIEDHVTTRAAAGRGPRIVVSDERAALLDSGGGVVRALPALREAGGEAPFAILNADSFWVDGPNNNLRRLIDAFDPARSDMLLLVANGAASVGFEGLGDFTMDATGALKRRAERQAAPFVYAGAIVTTPAIFRDAPAGPFSLNRLFDRAIANGRLHGLRLEGLWLHVGTPDAIALAERAIAEAAG